MRADAEAYLTALSTNDPVPMPLQVLEFDDAVDGPSVHFSAPFRYRFTVVLPVASVHPIVTALLFVWLRLTEHDWSIPVEPVTAQNLVEEITESGDTPSAAAGDTSMVSPEAAALSPYSAAFAGAAVSTRLPASRTAARTLDVRIDARFMWNFTFHQVVLHRAVRIPPLRGVFPEA